MKSLVQFISETFDDSFGNCTLFVPKEKQVDVETELESIDIYIRKVKDNTDTIEYRADVTHNKKDFNVIVKEYGLKIKKD